MIGKQKPASRAFVVGGVIMVLAVAWIIIQTTGGQPKDVTRIAHADPELQAASKEALKGLPAFIQELQSPKPGEGFAIKGAFKATGGLEYLWVRSPSFKNEVFTGTLDQQPIAVRGLNKGDSVTVRKADVYDWLVKDESGIRGMLTEKVLQKRSGR